MTDQLDWDRTASAVKHRMLARGIDREELARRIGVSTRTVDNLRSGQPVSRTTTLPKASRALEWPGDALERIGAGDTAPDDLPDEPWIEDRRDTIQEQVDRMRLDVATVMHEQHQMQRALNRLAEQLAELADER